MNNFFTAPLGRVRPALHMLRRFDIAILLTIAAFIIAYLWLSPIRVHDLTLEDSHFPAKGEFATPNSYRPDGDGDKERTLLHRAQFEYNALSQNIIHIRTLDCEKHVLLNGQNLLPKNISGNLCDDYNGAYFDISETAVKGTNKLEIKTQHIRSHHIVYFGFDVSSANLKSPAYLALVCLLATIFFYCVFTRLIRSSLPVYALAIILVALLLRIWVVSNTSALERSHDVYGHIEYMDILIDTKSLPEKQKCWSCYHPPYYFASMATVKVVLKKIGVSEFNLYQIMMLCSVATYSVCIYFAFLTIRRFFDRPSLQIFSMGLFAFLPSSVMHSVAINNDHWMFTLFSVSFYYFIVWWQTKATRAYYTSLLFASLSIMVKSSGIVMFALLGFFALGYAISQHRNFLVMVKRYSPAAALMFAALLFNPIADKIARPGDSGGLGSIIGNFEKLSGGLTISNEAQNYLHFDPVEFINHPFVHPIDDASGRQYYWTALFKTALYGEFRDFHAHDEGSKLRNAIAPISSIAFLLLLAFIIVHALLIRRENMARHAPLYTLIAICLAASILMRALLPSFPINDFRYIWSIMIAPCVLAPLAVDNCAQRNLPMLSYIGYGAMSASILVSFIFCLSMQ
ncbi:MAG TPA: glycosyltransferase family 39 protein [Cellvibrionaceae bacterium]